MGLFSWLFPSTEDRIKKAKSLIEREKFAEARIELESIDHPDVPALMVIARMGLFRMNLAHAISWAHAGDDHRVNVHLELANNFHDGGLKSEIKAAEREIDQIFHASNTKAAEIHAKKEAHQLAIDPVEGLVNDDEDMDEELQARLAFLEDGYPTHLQESIRTLGSEFMQAVLKMEEGDTKGALPVLLRLPDDVPVVRYERARAAHALGDPKSASRELRAFAEMTPHCQIGNNHTGVLLAQTLTESGNLEGAIATLREVRKETPDAGGPLYAQLLESNGELAEAEAVVRQLLLSYPNTDDLYLLLARIRIRGGHKAAAMAALETAMSKVCNTPGNCAYHPPHPSILKLLATLYLEEGTDTARAAELHEQLRAMAPAGNWEDQYLDAMMATATNQPNATKLTSAVYKSAPQEFRPHLEKHLPSIRGQR